MKLLRLCVAAAIGIVIASGFLAENALHVPATEHPSLKYAQTFARQSAATVEAVQIRPADGAVLEAWLFSPSHPNGAGAIVLHGVGDTRMGVIGQARLLLDAGYTVLTPDSRGHGSSGGDLVTYGVVEANDTHDWASMLLSRPGIDRLYGMGQSMGAAILIQALPHEPRFRAIAADCPFATFEEIAFDRLAQRGLPTQLLSWPVIQAGFLDGRVRYGVDLHMASPANALRSAHTPVLLIHGTADTNIPIRHSRELHAVNGGATELWEVPGAEHVASIGRDPEGYARHITSFFAAH